MNKRKYNCKMEDVPAFMEFVLGSFTKDKPDFLAYSNIFADPFEAEARGKLVECYDVEKSMDVLGHQKMVKKIIDGKLKTLRSSINQMEGYLKFAEKSLDISIDDFGIKPLRDAINKDKKIEKIAMVGHSMVEKLRRNGGILGEVGMSNTTLDNFNNLILEIEELNVNHDTKKNERSRSADNSTKVFNELWDKMYIILDAAHAMYRGVNDVKLKEYTLTHLAKRVNNARSKKSDETTPEAH